MTEKRQNRLNKNDLKNSAKNQDNNKDAYKINDISTKLMKNIEDGLVSLDVDIGDMDSYKKNKMGRDELDAKYEEITKNLKIDTALIEEVYEDVKKIEHEKFKQEQQLSHNDIPDEYIMSIEDEEKSKVDKGMETIEAVLTEGGLDISVLNQEIDKKDETAKREGLIFDKEEEKILNDALNNDEELEGKGVNDDEVDDNKAQDNVIEDEEAQYKNVEDEKVSEDASFDLEQVPVEVDYIKYEYRQGPIEAFTEKMKKKISNHYEKRRNSKTHNGAMSKVLVAVTCVFFSLIIYISYYLLVDSKDRLNNPYNERSILMEETVLRGTIYSSDEKILAQTINENDEWRRYYPYGSLFSHVVGRYDKGKTGIELGNDYDLLATDDTQIQKIINDVKNEKSSGNSIITTLNYKLQKIADQALGNRNGAVVAIEPSTGKILAMVSKPNYDPNYIATNWEKYSNADNSENALLNRATQGRYAPGSTFKVVSTLAYMRQQTYSNYSYDCKGICTIDGHNTRCYNTKVHGVQNLKVAFANSCNTAFANIGTILDISKFNNTCKELYFNKDLPYDYNYKGSSFDLVEGSKSTLKVDTAIGQGKTQITPLHNAMIASAVANKGVIMKPYLVDKIVNNDMEIVEVIEPKEVSQVMLPAEANVIGDMMSEVVNSGTAKALKNSAYTAAGKTGSAEYDETNNSHAWFIGYAPVQNPQIAVSIIVEKAGTGGTYAVPIAKKLFDAYIGNNN